MKKEVMKIFFGVALCLLLSSCSTVNIKDGEGSMWTGSANLDSGNRSSSGFIQFSSWFK